MPVLSARPLASFLVPLAVVATVLSGCESPLLTGRRQAPPPQQQPQQGETISPHRGPQQLPPVSGPRLPPGPNLPANETAPERQPLPSLQYLLNRPTPSTSGPAQVTSNVPPAVSSETIRVALLVPLSGTNAALGHGMLNAAEQAIFAFAGDKFELLPEDTRGTPDGALTAAQTAIGDGAKLILGPLLSGSVKAITPAAEAANVPVIAFSSDRTVAANGVWVMGFLPSVEVRRVIDYAAKQGITSFAALAPATTYGRTVVDAMKQAAVSHGVSVDRVQIYDPTAQDFSQPVRQLADYDARRAALHQEIARLKGRSDEASKKALARLERMQTFGDVPYQALLIADGGKRLQALAALLPFYDIDPAKVRMLGTGQWDVPGIGTEPALIGGWYAAPPPKDRAAFVAEYKKLFDANPPRLATLAYDSVALAAVLAKAHPKAPYTEATITDPNGFYGRDGVFRFQHDGTTERGLAILQVERHGAKVIDPAPETFQNVTSTPSAEPASTAQPNAGTQQTPPQPAPAIN